MHTGPYCNYEEKACWQQPLHSLFLYIGSDQPTDPHRCSVRRTWHTNWFDKGERHRPLFSWWCETIKLIMCRVRFLIHTQQNGDQAIHCAASAGHLHIVKALIDEYGVLPTTANNVSLDYLSVLHDLTILLLYSGWTSASSHGSKKWTHRCSSVSGAWVQGLFGFCGKGMTIYKHSVLLVWSVQKFPICI